MTMYYATTLNELYYVDRDIPVDVIRTAFFYQGSMKVFQGIIIQKLLRDLPNCRHEQK